MASDTEQPQTCKEEDEEVEGEGTAATMAALEAGAGAAPAGNKERESSVMRLPNMAGTGRVVVAAVAGVDATKDAEAEEEEGPKQLESGRAAGT